MISRVERSTSESLFASMKIADEQYYRHDSGRFGSSTRPIEIDIMYMHRPIQIPIIRSHIHTILGLYAGLSYTQHEHTRRVIDERASADLLQDSFVFAVSRVSFLLLNCRLHEVRHESAY